MTRPVTSRSRQGIVGRLASSRFVHHTMAASGAYAAANAILRRFPLVRRISDPGPALVRLTEVSCLPLLGEVFGPSGYGRAMSGRPRVETLADIGCSFGWFPCLVRALQPDDQPAGVLFDANSASCDEARWHLSANNLKRLHVIHGAVGVPDHTEAAHFHILPASTQSALSAPGPDHPYPIKGRAKVVAVPVVTVEKEWLRLGLPLPIDLMKIDVEGAEMDFLNSEQEFVCNVVRRVLIEWHGWRVPFAQLTEWFLRRGWKMESEWERSENMGVVSFRNERWDC